MAATAAAQPAESGARNSTPEAARFFGISRGRRVALTDEQWRRFECCRELVAKRNVDVLAAACISDTELCTQLVRIGVQDIFVEAISSSADTVGSWCALRALVRAGGTLQLAERKALRLPERVLDTSDLAKLEQVLRFLWSSPSADKAEARAILKLLDRADLQSP